MGRQFLLNYRAIMKFLVVLALFVAAAHAEPEAEAEADPEAYWYNNYYSPYAYSGYRWGGWGGYRRAYGYASPYWGGRYLWKRDAESQPESKAVAEANPGADPEAYWYNNYYSPYAYSGYRWGGWGGYRRAYGYASPYWGGRYFWKRDAESQPESKADAEADPEAYWYNHHYSPYAYNRCGGWGGYRRAYGWGGYRRAYGWY